MLVQLTGRRPCFYDPRRRRGSDVTVEALIAAEWYTYLLRHRYESALRAQQALEAAERHADLRAVTNSPAHHELPRLTREDCTWLHECSHGLLDDFELELAQEIVDWYKTEAAHNQGWLKLETWGGLSIAVKYAANAVATLGILFHGWMMPLSGHCVHVRPGRVDVE